MKSERIEKWWVEQGMINPRDQSIGYRHWGEYITQAQAEAEAKKLDLARILKVIFFDRFEDGKRISSRI